MAKLVEHAVELAADLAELVGGKTVMGLARSPRAARSLATPMARKGRMTT
ncbi:hypothetical protein [Persicimonas caeni]|nr:hypothetical protein [Persicimonas caeni]